MNYLINYRSYNIHGLLVKEGIMKVKNASSELAAKIKLDKHLDKVLNGHSRLVVDSISEDNDIINIFKDIFR